MTHIIPNRDALFGPFEQHFNRMFDKVFGDDGLQSLRNIGKSGYPKLDVIVSDGRYIIEAAIPGVSPSDLKVEILPYKDEASTWGIDSSKRLLKVSGKMSRDYQYSKSTDYAVKELRRSYFERSMLLPSDLEGDPEAVIDNGMLRLTWNLPESQKPNKAKVVDVKRVT